MPRRRAERDDDMMVATDTGSVFVDGETKDFKRGVTRARRGSPIVKAIPGLWKPIEAHYDIERATAAPGERRTG